MLIESGEGALEAVTSSGPCYGSAIEMNLLQPSP
jgi:hypothetical protein